MTGSPLESRFRRPFYRQAGLALLLIAFASCGTRPALVPVHGKIYYKGQLLTFGTIVFAPDDTRGRHGPLACAEIQPDGSYTLRTGEAEGAVSGWHRISVLALDRPAPTANGARGAAPRPLLPDKYSDPEKSDLHCEVQPGKQNGFNLYLE